MSQIIQDYKNWKNLCVMQKDAQSFLYKYRDTFLTKYISVEEMNRIYTRKTALYISFAQMRRRHPDSSPKDIIEKGNNLLKRFRLDACFYRPCDGHFMQLISCENMDEDDCIKDVLCDGCAFADSRKKYEYLLKQVIDLEKQKEIAKRKLLDNFRFRKK